MLLAQVAATRQQFAFSFLKKLAATNFPLFRQFSLSNTSTSESSPRRRPFTRHRISDFVDRIEILTAGGRGGDGCISFTRGPNQEMVPPDGGSGGNGGSVFVEARNECTSLRMSQRHVRGGFGSKGMKALRSGARGEDKVVHVPLGTVVRLVGSEANSFGAGLVLCDLNEHGQKAEVARGGAGGKGNAHFKSSTNRSPYRAQQGTPGEIRRIELELKTIADVGLVGLPNAGKSTLLRAMSHAKPKVANYPFTTLKPHIGVATCKLRPGEDESRCTIADIPGLIEGAHDNRGLGHEFLRHIERTSILIYVLDMSKGTSEHENTPAPLQDLQVLKKELEMYQQGLSSRSSIVVANKMDGGAVAVDNLKAFLKAVPDDIEVFPASALERTGIDEIVRHVIGKVRSPSFNKANSML